MTRASSDAGGVLSVSTDSALVTAIERFSLDGSEPPDPPPDESEELVTITPMPPSDTESTAARPEMAAALDRLQRVLRADPAFVAGLLLAGYSGELVLYSQWRVDGAPPSELPESWSLRPALGGAPRVDGRTYLVDFTAPDPVSAASRPTTPFAHFGVFTVPAGRLDDVLEVTRRHAPDSIGSPGLQSINFHRSLDGRRVVNLGLWTGFAEFTELLSRPGFTGGDEYWRGISGFRSHYFEVVSVAAREMEQS